MWVITKSRLQEFWEADDQHDAQGPLEAWYAVVSNRSTSWTCWNDVKAVYGTADAVGNCIVFNIGGHKYRLIARVFYNSHKVYVLKVMTHPEYDRDLWKEECGCYKPPPKPAKVIVRATRRPRKR